VAYQGSVPYLALAAAAIVTGLSMWRIASLSGDVEGLRTAQRELDRLAAELRDSADRMRFLAMHDSLTGLGNRALFYERLDHHLAQRNGPSAVLLMDLDNFKSINDTHGHHAGDELLKTVASRLGTVSREGDTVARLGGDEFVVILVNVDSAQAQTAANRYMEAVNQLTTVKNEQIPVQATAGLAMAYPGTNSSWVVQEADAAMYAVKKQTRAQPNSDSEASLTPASP
jgi:diguanylate cyclase (GGDEF)-like protein